MSTTSRDITRWFHAGRVDGYARMIVWCDTFSYDDYPEYTNKTGDMLRAYTGDSDGKNMQKVVEVYDLTIDPAPQINSDRAFNF